MSSQADRLGLDHSDQSTAIVVNVAAIFTERTASSRRRGPDCTAAGLPRGAVRLRRASSWTFTSTSTPKIPQKRASGTEKPQLPRSQYDW